MDTKLSHSAETFWRPALLRSIEVILCCVIIPNAVLRPKPKFKTVLFNFLGLVGYLSCWKIKFSEDLRDSLIFQSFYVCVCVCVFIFEKTYVLTGIQTLSIC